MVAWIGPAISAGATLMGGLLKNKEDRRRFERQNQITDARVKRQDALTSARILAAEARTDRRINQQMRYQERMSSSGYQRAMQDMRKAGLNPILAYKQGGASSPSGASSGGISAPGGFAPAASTPSVDALTPAVASGLAARRLYAEVGNLEATQKNLAEQNINLQAERARINAHTKLTNMENMVKGEIYNSAKAAGAAAKTDEEFYKSPQGKFLRTINRYIQAFTGSVNSARSIGR